MEKRTGLAKMARLTGDDLNILTNPAEPKFIEQDGKQNEKRK